MANQFVLPKGYAVSPAGVIYVGAKLYFYGAGTTSPKTIYADANLTQAQANPITLDASGNHAVVYLASGSYRVVLIDSSGTQVALLDPVETPDAVDVNYQLAFPGAHPRLLQAKLTEVVSALDFGLKADGSTNDSPAITAAITAMSSLGGGDVLLPAGTIAISDPLVIASSNVRLVGQGSGRQPVTGGSQSATTLKWTGAAGATMLSVQNPNPANQTLIMGCGVQGIHFDCNSSAAYGLKVLSIYGGRFRDVYVQQATSVGILVSVVAGAQTNRDTQFCEFDGIYVYNLSVGTWCMQLDGDQSVTPLSNTSLNVFRNMDLVYGTGGGLMLGDCDSNLFMMNRIYCNSGLAGGTSVLMTGNALALAASSRGNIFRNLDASGKIIVQGTDAIAFASADNVIDRLNAQYGTSASNSSFGVSNVNIGTGAILDYSWFSGPQVAPVMQQLALADTYAGATGLRNIFKGVGTPSLTTLLVLNTSEDHIVLDDGTHQWAINISGNDLRLVQLAGPTGSVLVPGLQATIVASGAYWLTAPITVTAPGGGGADPLPATPSAYIPFSVNGIAGYLAWYRP